MEIIKWVNGEGYTLVLSDQEADDLEDALKTAILTGKGESPSIDVEVESD